MRPSDSVHFAAIHRFTLPTMSDRPLSALEREELQKQIQMVSKIVRSNFCQIADCFTG